MITIQKDKFFGDKFNKSSLNPAVRRLITAKENDLGRTCRMIWANTNEKGESYLYAHFCKNYDKLIVTLAVHVRCVSGGWLPCWN